MFLSRVQIGSYLFGSIRVGFFWVRVYSGRFFTVPVLSGKINLDPKGTCKFLVRFRVGYFLVGSGSEFRVQVKMPRPNSKPYIQPQRLIKLQPFELMISN